MHRTIDIVRSISDYHDALGFDRLAVDLSVPLHRDDGKIPPMLTLVPVDAEIKPRSLKPCIREFQPTGLLDVSGEKCRAQLFILVHGLNQLLCTPKRNRS